MVSRFVFRFHPRSVPAWASGPDHFHVKDLIRASAMPRLFMVTRRAYPWLLSVKTYDLKQPWMAVPTTSGHVALVPYMEKTQTSTRRYATEAEAGEDLERLLALQREWAAYQAFVEEQWLKSRPLSN
jgi:hypothetical protein